MKTLSVAISEADYRRYGFHTDTVEFDDFIDNIAITGSQTTRKHKRPIVSKLPGASGFSERAAKAQDSLKRGDTWYTIEELDQHLREAVKRGVAHEALR
jgi:hypothetical protein